MPPIMVARSPKTLPKRRPIISATKQTNAVVRAIILAENATFTESAAKLTPTARASMLVAIAWSANTGIVKV